VAVAGIVDGDACGKVDKAATLGIPKQGVFGAGGIDAARSDPTRHSGGLAGDQGGGGGLGHSVLR